MVRVKVAGVQLPRAAEESEKVEMTAGIWM